MRSSRSRGHDVFDVHPADEQRVANQRAMAAPRHRFRAHDGGALLARQFQQTRKTGAKFLGGHVVGVAAEGSVTPAEIGGIFFGVAEAAERSEERRVGEEGRSRWSAYP